MNIHEYQAKQLFAEAGVAVPNGTVAQSEQEFDQAISALPTGKPIVVKAQIHAGGRGKGTFTDGFQGVFMWSLMVPLLKKKHRQC